MNLHPPVNGGDRTQGPADAPMTLVEFGDYQCPYCAQAHSIVEALIAEHGDGLRYVFRNFPLPMHANAMNAALVAEAAPSEDFWALHRALFANQDALDPGSLIGFATEAGVPEASARDGLAGSSRSKVEADMQSGERSGVAGTPTFFINGRLHGGDWSREALSDALRAARGR